MGLTLTDDEYGLMQPKETCCALLRYLHGPFPLICEELLYLGYYKPYILLQYYNKWTGILAIWASEFHIFSA